MTATIPNTSSTAQAPIDHRYDFVLLFDVVNGNPNGDPDAGNSPRVDPETARGLVSDVALKRKLRNFVALAKTGSDGQPEPGYEIYVKERAILNKQHERAYEALGVAPTPKQETPGVRDWMCQTFFDVRTFGAVMSTEINAGQVRGPVQITFGRSVDPIMPLEQAITRLAVTTEKESIAQAGGNRTMGRKEIVPYGLYVAHGFVSPQLARQTGFSGEDLALLWKGLEQMFEFDRSAARGEMATQRLLVFEHESPLGNAPAHRLFDRVTIVRRDTSRPPREYADYTVSVNTEGFPAGITLHDIV